MVKCNTTVLLSSEDKFINGKTALSWPY